MALATACGDDDDSSSDAGEPDSGSNDAGSHHDASGGGSGGTTMDASTSRDSGGHDHADSGNMMAVDSGIDASTADDDGGMTDAGFDGGTDSGNACNVMCNGKCCAANQVCGTVQPKTVDAGWAFGTGATVLHVVLGSTVTFDTNGIHTVNQFPNATAFTNCDFTGLTPLPTTNDIYTFTADTLGDFYFGCSVGMHCANNTLKKHIIVDAPGMECTQ